MRPAPRAAGGGPRRRLDTLLIIEGDATMRLALGCMVADAHRQVVLAHGADTALEEMERIDPDIVLCGSASAGMSAREFCRHMKAGAQWRYVPVIVVAQQDDRALVTDLLKSGADDVLVNPVRIEELRPRVLRALHTRAQYLELRRAAREAGASLMSMRRLVHPASI
jgi:DNA-binding response OmpR family regulator